MTKVTDRYNDKNLIDLAKQQYVDKKTSTIPSEIVQLPSQGKIYPKDHPLREGIIEIRHMTAYDEDILTNLSYIQQGVVLDKLIESITLQDINVSELASCDVEAIILTSRILAYGSDYPVTVTDPKTNSILNRTIDLTKVQYKDFELTTNENGESSFNCSNDSVIKFSYCLKQNKNTNNERLISSFLLSTIREVDGKRTSEEIDEFLKYKFSLADSRKFQRYVSDNAPAILKEYEFEGEDGGTFTAGFQFGPELLWPETN
jgi:hypothetical protein